MPIDTRPLTPARRLAMALVLLGLFAASLGFAQYLVSRHHEVVVVKAVFPPAFDVPVHLYDHVPGLVTAWEAREGDWVRRVGVFKYDADVGSARALQNAATDLFVELFGAEPENYRYGKIDTWGAVELSGVVEGKQGAWLRVARVTPGQAVAFCYSGPDPQSDLDSKTFDELATRCIRISVVDSSAVK